MARFLPTVAVLAALLAPPGIAAPAMAAGTLDWQPCDLNQSTGVTDFECARLTVPMSRLDPDGPTFSLAVARHRSTGSDDQRIGSLFYNPGGPGGSGLDSIAGAWAMLPDEVRDRFDLVTWDPRGVGATTPAPVACDVPGSEPLAPSTGPVSLAAVADNAIAASAAALSACQAANADIAGHLGTMEVVEDLDRLRVAVGDPSLTFWGVSYGTELGYAYAVTHPDRVRAILLDSPMDPSPWTIRRIADGIDAADDGYRMFARFHPESARLFEQVTDRLARRPVRLSSGYVLDRWSAPWLIRFMSAFQGAYGGVVRTIDLLDDATDGSAGERSIARIRLGAIVRTVEALWTGPSWWAGNAIYCADVAGRPMREDVLALARQLRRTVSLQAAVEAASAAGMCQGLTLPPDPVPASTAGSGPSVPVVVIGSTHDGRTNGRWVDRMTRAFPSARSITYLGGQHGLYGSVGSACVDGRVSRFLTTTALPPRNVRCPNTYEPGGLVP